MLGPWPGLDALEAQTTLLGELSDVPAGVRAVPSVVQLPQRGPWAETVPRTAAVLTDMPVELGPHGWKLSDRPGRDDQRVRSLLHQDLDALAVAAHGWTGPLAVSMRGPWTLASLLYLARGDRVLGDPGAVRELVASFADGLGGLLATLRTVVPGAEPVLVVREPMLPDVLGGAVATFSGHGRIPAPEPAAVSAVLADVVRAARAAGATQVVAHAGARFATRSVAALRDSGADALGLALAPLRGPQWERVAEVVEGGQRLWFALPKEAHGRRPDPVGVAAGLVRPWTAVGLPATALDDVVVHAETSAGTAGGGDLVLSRPQAARAAVAVAVRVALELAERAAG